MRLIPVVASCVFAALLTLGCSANPEQSQGQRPILFAPGLGMSTLRVDVDPEGITFDFLVPVMNPDTPALDIALESGLPRDSVNNVAQWLALEIDSNTGAASNSPGVQVAPVSFGENFAKECPRYLDMAGGLEALGWKADKTLVCAPFDYRYPPGENTFVTDLASRVTELFKETGQKTVLACHSQGCLMTLHALRTLNQEWVSEYVHSLFSLAGQFSGCSDCVSWAFSPGWDWNAHDPDGSPVDPTWVGEMALGLQPEVYADTVLYRGEAINGESVLYRATDTVQLLNDRGARAMAQATKRYSLNSRPWFQKGNRFGQQLPVPARFVFGSDLSTTIGFDFSSPNQPRPIMSDGDGGDSSFMNRAPKNWTRSVACDMRELPGVSHMEIITNPVALNLLSQTASVAAQEVECVGP